jgi:succinate dehydrogenase/fumarate reductase flavoprotein subunit
VRYASLLEAGVDHLRHVRQRALNTLAAANLHELMRCLEALNLMEIGETSMLCALERKETRADKYDPFTRVDFPDENPDMKKFLVFKRVEGVPSCEWRTPRRI